MRHLLQSALILGQISGPFEGEFPRYVHGWVVLNGQTRVLFRGRLTNREQGQYKGYFETLDDVPAAIRANLEEGGPWWREIEA